MESTVDGFKGQVDFRQRKEAFLLEKDEKSKKDGKPQ